MYLLCKKTERTLSEISECEKFRHYLINRQVSMGRFWVIQKQYEKELLLWKWAFMLVMGFVWMTL